MSLQVAAVPIVACLLAELLRRTSAGFSIPCRGFAFDGQVHQEAAAGLNLSQPIREKAPVYIRVVLTIDEGCLSYFEAWMSAVIAGSASAIRASMRSTAHR
jgi:hypothetical protein